MAKKELKMDKTLWNKTRSILGENPLNHDLFIGSTRNQYRLQACRSFKEIVSLFYEVHYEVYHKNKNLPGRKMN